MKNSIAIVVATIVIVGAGYQGWKMFSSPTIKLEPTYSAQENLYKCKDSNNNVTYSDTICVNSTDQHLDIVVPPFDEAAAKKLKDRQLNNKKTSKTKSKVLIIKSSKTGNPSKKCQSYTDLIKNKKSQLRAGYTPAEGEIIKNSINKYKKLYRNNCT